MLNMATVVAGFGSEEKLHPFKDFFFDGLTGTSSDGSWYRSSLISLKATAIFLKGNSEADFDALRNDLERNQWIHPEAEEHRRNTLKIIRENFAERDPASDNKDSVRVEKLL